MQKRLKEWEKVKKEEGVKWVHGTTAMKEEEILSKKTSKKDIKKGCKKRLKK